MGTAGYTDRDVTVRGLKLHYQEWGDPKAPAIVMLHGFGVSGHMFDEFAERLSNRFRLIALDQRGHGDSDWAEDGNYSREEFVEDLEAVRQALGIKTFVLVGHSMGGLNAVSYTAKYPERVRALVLVDVGPEAAKEGVDNIIRFTRGPDELEFEEFVQLAHQFNPRRTIENIRERMRHRLKPMGNGKWTWKFDKRFRDPNSGIRVGSELSNDETWQLFRSISVPTLLVRGAESDVLTQEVAERTAREMRRARLVVIRGAGHSVPGDNPDDFSAAVETFLEDVASGRFEPEAAAEPASLQQLVEEQEASRRRPGALTLIGVSIGVSIAVASAAFMIARALSSRAEKRRREEAAKARREALPVGLGSLDVEQARQRALKLVGQLSEVGRDGVARARTALKEADLQQARATALDVAQALEERAKAAPETLRTVAQKVDTGALRRGGKKRSKVGSAFGVARAAASLGRSRREPRSRRGAKFLPWRA